MIFNLPDLTIIEKQHYLQHIIAPRPICFASTIDKKGNVNLSPFSFFNIFSYHPAIVVFSPVRRMRDNTHKHTLQNIMEVPEVVINMVTYDIVQQASLASSEFPKGVDEFLKAGFSKEAASKIRPPMVKESKVKLECRVMEIKSLGEEGGAGQLAICEILAMHIDDDLLSANKKMDQRKLDLVARLGGDWYTRISPDNLFKVKKPNAQMAIGIEALPAVIRTSAILTGHYLAQLANVQKIPDPDPSFHDKRLEEIADSSKEKNEKIHGYIQELLKEEKIDHAWQVVLSTL